MEGLQAYLRRLTPVQWGILILIVGFFTYQLGSSIFNNPASFIARIIAIFTAFTVHEFAHAWTADSLGDDLPRIQGRLTLDPRAHLDVYGSLALLFTGFGWAKPVQVNVGLLQRRSPYGLLLVTLAGPVSNLLLAIAVALPLKIGLIDPRAQSAIAFLPTLGGLLVSFVFINLVLFFFNLIPVYPLDGEKIAVELAPGDVSRFFMRIRPYAPFILLILVFVFPQVLGTLIGAPSNWLLNILIN